MAQLQPSPSNALHAQAAPAAGGQASSGYAPPFRRLYVLARAQANTANFVQAMGVALIVCGVVGLAASLYSYALVRQAFAGARDIGVFAPDDKTRAVSGLRSIAIILDDASAASANLTSSFQESRTSLETASRVATDVAESFRQVAQAASLQIFDIQPLGGLVQPFRDSSERLDGLAADLTRTAAAAGANATDMRRLASDFARLRLEVDGLRQTVARLPNDLTSSEGAAHLEIALSAMLLWIGLQGLASIVGGLAILLGPLSRRA